MNYQDMNIAAIERWIAEGWEWGTPISHEIYEAAKAGEWNVLLTPTRFVPHEWFGDMRDKKVLGLASGGGQQMPIFTALGAKCTVLDYSEKQLESEKMVAEREGYEIRIIRADMTKRLPFLDEEFDLIFERILINTFPFNPLKNPEQMQQLAATDSGVQFSHSLEEQIGGQLEAGFVLTNLMEDTNGEGNLHDHNIPTFVATRAVKA